MNATLTPPHKFQFTSEDGLRIACSRWDSRGRPRAILQIAHGLGEHIGRYIGLIEVLLRAGLVAYGNDHRGHGRSAPSPERFGDFGEGGFNLLVDDMVRLTRIAKEENPEKPFLLLGHSMGSFAAQQYILDHSESIDGVVLSGSGALDRLKQLANSMPAGGNVMSVMNAPFAPTRTPHDWLSRDTAVIDAFMNDPLCFGELQPASNESFFAASARLADPVSLRRIRQNLPIYLFSGSEDPVGQRLEGVRILIEGYRAAGICHISYDFYEGGRHEMLNEINRSEVRTNLLGWIWPSTRVSLYFLAENRRMRELAPT